MMHIAYIYHLANLENINRQLKETLDGNIRTEGHAADPEDNLPSDNSGQG